MQTDAAISPGNSGGALVNRQAQVMGINVAYIPPSARAVSIGFAIPSATVTDVVEQLLDDGTVSHAFFGIQPTALTPQIAARLGAEVDEGVVVLGVVEDGPAAQAGILAGDIILSVDGTSTHRLRKIARHFGADSIGRKTDLRLIRSGAVIAVQTTIAERNAA